MNLLDTHVLVWAINDPSKLSRSARRIVEDGEFVVSCASLWELLSKKGRPTALLDDPVLWWNKFIRRAGVNILSIHAHHVQQLDTMPGPIRDPFDRILMAQCMVDGLRLVTKDQSIREFYQGHVHVVW